MEAVIKIGGSLAEEPASLKALCQELSVLAKTHRILIIPGGGKFADAVREFDQMFNLSDVIAHEMAILAMDQFGLFLSDITPNSYTLNAMEKGKKLPATGMLPILLPSRLMFHTDPLEHSWDVTSDSIAAYIADRLRAEKLILATDVDGVFTNDPKRDLNARLIEKISANQLLSWDKRTSVDKSLPKILLTLRSDCYVVNGKYPERITAILENKKTCCTRIIVD
jgi:aspartokinase-like uncharacterized kinase